MSFKPLCGDEGGQKPPKEKGHPMGIDPEGGSRPPAAGVPDPEDGQTADDSEPDPPPES